MRCWVIAAVAAVAISGSTLAHAASPTRTARAMAPPKSVGKAKITIELVVAREKGPVDPGLEGVARQLRSRGLRSVRRVTADCATVSEGRGFTVRVDGHRMRVSVLDVSRDTVHIRYEAYRDGEELFHQVFWTPRGKTGPLAGMGAYRGGQLLGVVSVGQ